MIRKPPTLLDEVLGPDASVEAIKSLIAGRAAGNPFFDAGWCASSPTWDAVIGDRGGYVCRAEMSAEVTVPATLQAAIAARIDRLDAAAKQTLNAAAVIGSALRSLAAAHCVGQ